MMQVTEHKHVVQLYRDLGFLRRAVAGWIAPALRSGGGALLVCSPQNADLIRAELLARRIDAPALESEGRLVVVDAEGLMSRFVIDGMPDASIFLRLVDTLVGALRERLPSRAAEVRAWGEMVNLLHHRGEAEAARSLEHAWNEAIERNGLRLLCSYRVDNLDESTNERVLRALCDGHTQLLPEESDAHFESALKRALRDELGEADAGTFWDAHATRPPLSVQMPPAESVLIAIRAALPARSSSILQRTRAYLAEATA